MGGLQLVVLPTPYVTYRAFLSLLLPGVPVTSPGNRVTQARGIKAAAQRSAGTTPPQAPTHHGWCWGGHRAVSEPMGFPDSSGGDPQGSGALTALSSAATSRRGGHHLPLPGWDMHPSAPTCMGEGSRGWRTRAPDPATVLAALPAPAVESRDAPGCPRPLGRVAPSGELEPAAGPSLLPYWVEKDAEGEGIKKIVESS